MIKVTDQSIWTFPGKYFSRRMKDIPDEFLSKFFDENDLDLSGVAPKE